jgi:hypothetical protein
MNKKKYAKYVNEVNPIKFLYFPEIKEYAPGELNHYDYRDNEESPHFIEISLNGGAAAVGRKKGKSSQPLRQVAFIDPRIYYSTCYRHAPMRETLLHRLFYETRSFLSLDPDNPTDIGMTLHMWMGEGDKAECHIVDKTTTQLVPMRTVGMPSYPVETHGKPGMMLVISDNPLEAIVPGREMLPPKSGQEDYKGEKWVAPKIDPIRPGEGKFGKYYSEINVKGLPVYPAHQGKLARVMYYDGGNNPEAPHCIDVHLVYEAGIGFGLGDAGKLPLLPNGETDQTTSYEPLLPHKHPFYQTYSFNPTVKDNYPDLGGTVEFWLGEGEDAERYFITKAATVLVPKNTLHLPLYVREVRKPFTIVSVLDTPLWVGCYSQKLPAGFKL